MSTAEDTRTKYEFEPFELIFLRRREEVARLVAVAGYALRSVTGLARLTESLHEPAEAVDRAREIAALALQEVEADLPLLHSAAAVLIWGALEAAVIDFLVRWLVSHPACLTAQPFSNIRVRLGEYEHLEGEDRMRFLVRLLEREVGASLKPGVGRFGCLLKPLGIGPSISDDTRRDLTELAAVRNVVVHRSAVADARFTESCPWLGLAVGDLVRVGGSAFDRYLRATSEYAAAIIDAAEAIAESGQAGSTGAQPGAGADDA
jgi:hypothetical protein